MLRRLFAWASLAAAVFLVAPGDLAARADVLARTPAAQRIEGYLARNDIDGVTLLGAPPSPDSPRGEADRALYLATRAQAGSARWRRAVRDNDLWNGGAVEGLSCTLGRTLSPRATPITYRLLQRVEADVRTVGTPPKDFYNRTRPPIGDSLPICVPREEWMKTNASYPSGHAMTGWAWALVLGELAPDRIGPLMAAGGAIGDSRVICGVHYQSDVEAGRKLGAAMVARLHAEPAFRRDLAAAKAELRRTHAAPPPTDCPS